MTHDALHPRNFMVPGASLSLFLLSLTDKRSEDRNLALEDLTQQSLSLVAASVGCRRNNNDADNENPVLAAAFGSEINFIANRISIHIDMQVDISVLVPRSFQIFPTESNLTVIPRTMGS